MTRFVAETLDLSRLPAPQVIRDLSYETILAERVTRLAGELTAAGIPWDVGALETDPLKILEEGDAVRELLDLARINDAAKAVLLPYAEGADLDVLGALFGVLRLTGEGDERYRRRIALAPEAYTTAGSAGAYAYHALSVSPAIVDVGVTSPATGVARVVVLTDEVPGAGASPALVAAVRARLLADDVRPLTDHVVVQAAQVTPYAIDVRIAVPAGPDPTLIAASARAALQTLAADSHRVGRALDVSQIAGAAWSPSARRIDVLQPAAGVAGDPLCAPWCTSVTVSMEVADG